MRRSTLLLLMAVSSVFLVAHAIASVGSELRGHAIRGFYKAVARTNSPQAVGVDGKFDFKGDGAFTFTRKTLKTTLITQGTYKADEMKVVLTKSKGKTEWPDFWQDPAVMTIDSNGNLEMNGLVYEASLIGKVFVPGLYLCAAAPINHYYFSAAGGYKYKGQAVLTGEYWVEKSADPISGQAMVQLVLNILRIDGGRVNYHQVITLDEDGGFTLEKKYKYRRAGDVGTEPEKAG